MTEIEIKELWFNGRRYVLSDDANLPPAPVEPLEPEPEPPAFNSAAFYDSIRGSLFGGSLNQGQVDGINLIGKTCIDARLTPMIEQSAYVLATVYHETAKTMQPIEEYGGSSRRYAPWYGRGHVQLTWEENYKKQQDKLQDHSARPQGVPYEVHDDWNLALHPQTSALICVLGMQDGDFTGKKLSDYINAQKVDYVNARRIVNGTDKASTIADYARKFESAIRAGMG